MREVECIVIRTNRESSDEVIPQSFCVDAGLAMPEAARACGETACPQWIVTQSWQTCAEAECVAKNAGKKED